MLTLRKILGCICLAETLLVGGCCGELRPSVEEVQEWVAKELPPGSSEADVRAFGARRDFTYARMSPGFGQVFRAISGCDWKKPVVQVEIDFDESNQVSSTHVRAFSVGLP